MASSLEETVEERTANLQLKVETITTYLGKITKGGPIREYSKASTSFYSPQDGFCILSINNVIPDDIQTSYLMVVYRAEIVFKTNEKKEVELYLSGSEWEKLVDALYPSAKAEKEKIVGQPIEAKNNELVEPRQLPELREEWFYTSDGSRLIL